MNEVQFSVAGCTAWAPGLKTIESWKRWFRDFSFCDPQPETEPKVRAMSPLLRRRTDFLGKMALEVAYQCMGKRAGISAVFCSRHGEVSRSVGMLLSMAKNEPVSPAAFSLSVHNAIAGLFSISRLDKANHIAISAKDNIVEHAIIEATGLLHDGEEQVLVVIYNNDLPEIYHPFRERNELPYAWAWLIEKPKDKVITLSRSSTTSHSTPEKTSLPQELEILRFFLNDEKTLHVSTDYQSWQWRRHAE